MFPTAQPPRYRRCLGRIRKIAGVLVASLAAGLLALFAGTGLEASAAGQSYSERVLGRASLLSYWRLGETAGNVARDRSGGRDGT